LQQESSTLFWQPGELVTSAKEVMFSSLFVCLSVCLLATLRKNFQADLHEIFRNVTNKRLNFGGDPDHGSVCVSRHW